MKGSFRVGEWLIRPDLGRIASPRKSVRVEPKVMQVLEVLAENAGEMVPREELISRVWPGVFVTDDVLTRCISVLRKVFEDRRSEPRVIETISKRGYRLIAPVRSADESRGANRLLAVLPFSHPDGDAEAKRWSEALTETVIETLADIPRLRVKAWSTVLRFQNDAADPLAVARELGADAALVGRALRRGGRLTIFAELVEVAHGWWLWGARYGVQPAEGLSPAVENFALQIAAKIREKLIPRETGASSRPASADSEMLETESPDESPWREVLETSPP
jgi:DNA-binding winged helix-turn-helix (wHTH) protein